GLFSRNQMMLTQLRRVCASPRHRINVSSIGLRWQSTAVNEGPPVTETNRTEATLKRFWKTVSVGQRDDAYAVLLDKRALKTPSGNTLLLPPNKSLVAALIATEWDNQDLVLKHHALPMTSLASRAIDAMKDEQTRSDVRTALLDYLDTDTIWQAHSREPFMLLILHAASRKTIPHNWLICRLLTGILW
ncbi:unnamed protein product, partial [Mycena citricolor]